MLSPYQTFSVFISVVLSFSASVQGISALPEESRNSSSLRVVFLAPTLGHYQRDESYKMRGHFTASLLNASVASCKNVNVTLYDVFVHVKFACDFIVQYAPKGSVHIIDHVDGFDSPAHMDGQIVSTMLDLKHNCTTLLCAIIPHLVNHKCPAGNVSTSGIIGLLGNSDTPILKAYLQDQNFTVVNEHVSRNFCNLIRQVSVAVAWSPYMEIVQHKAQIKGLLYYNPKSEQEAFDYHWRKPATRFTNAVLHGVPTIAYSGFASYRMYATDFLCQDPPCVADLIRKILSGQMDEKFAKCRVAVSKELDTDVNIKRYVDYFEELYYLKQLKIANATVNK